MHSLTGNLVHEFMHSENAGAATPKGDRSLVTLSLKYCRADCYPGRIRDVQYGANECKKLAKAEDSQSTFHNADSYHWFALHAFYNSFCGTTFVAPLAVDEDLQADASQLENSPEYDGTPIDSDPDDTSAHLGQ